MNEKRVYRLVHDTARQLAAQQCWAAPEGYVCTIQPATRSLEQNAKFHAICTDFSSSTLKWAGKRRTAAQWKVLLVSGHAIATGNGAEIIPGLESEYVNLRESTALMSKSRGSSLIEYAIAFAATNEITLNEFARYVDPQA